MIGEARAQLLRELSSFLCEVGTRPRAVVVTGVEGIGKSTLCDLLQVELLAGAGPPVLVLDDADELSSRAITAVAGRLRLEPQLRLLVAAVRVPEALRTIVDRLCERRVVQLAPLEADDARRVLADLGVQPWSLHAVQVLRRAAGVPRRIIDEAFNDVDDLQVVATDRSFEAACSAPAIAELLLSLLAGDGRDQAQLLATCAADAARGRAEAHVVLAEHALLERDLERAVQHGECAAACTAATAVVQQWGAAVAAAARALRGEAVALLSLHALAGAAARDGHGVLQVRTWQHAALAAAHAGDAATARRTTLRAIAAADASEAHALGLQLRLALARIELGASHGTAALAYADEAQRSARACGLRMVQVEALAVRARALLAAARVEEGRTAAQEAIELMPADTSSRDLAVEVRIVAAHAHVAAGAGGLALAVLGEPAAVAARALGSGPEFRLALEGVRIAARDANAAAAQTWHGVLHRGAVDQHSEALRAARVESDAWLASLLGRPGEASRLARRAVELWDAAGEVEQQQVLEPLLRVHDPGQRPQLVVLETSAPSELGALDVAACEALTRREREIARYVAGGMTNPEIARELHLSPRTVEHHVASILRKLELPNRRALVLGRLRQTAR